MLRHSRGFHSNPVSISDKRHGVTIRLGPTVHGAMQRKFQHQYMQGKGSTQKTPQQTNKKKASC